VRNSDQFPDQRGQKGRDEFAANLDQHQTGLELSRRVVHPLIERYENPVLLVADLNYGAVGETTQGRAGNCNYVVTRLTE
jgi:hypothetical protein